MIWPNGHGEIHPKLEGAEELLPQSQSCSGRRKEHTSLALITNYYDYYYHHLSLYVASKWLEVVLTGPGPEMEKYIIV